MRRIGSHKERRVDIRIVAATNRDIKREIDKGCFREDLYYRINVLALDLPPLRERDGDTELLINHFLGKDHDLDDDATLIAYSWPGNIRQLINTLERARILADDRVITISDLPEELRSENTLIRAANSGLHSPSRPSRSS